MFAKHEICRFIDRYRQRLYNHPNYLPLNILDNSETVTDYETVL